MKRKRKNPIKIGQRKGKLTIVKESPKRSKDDRKYYVCKCDCGKSKEIVDYSLRTNRVVSCGCFVTERASKAAGEYSWNRRYASYSESAKERKVKFKLTKSEFIRLCSKNCFYCGNKPAPYNPYLNKNGELFNKQRGYPPKTVKRAWILTNGIDRTNNEKGYTVENCITCCKMCNSMKSIYSKGKFLNQCKKITNYHMERK